ncbi:hypothetical protein AA313_de0203713 [Arthrobotrys entomopaga]|nr:hypothetical protein AA313_de0203713 [Arthrobotrys entomopaga]
MLDNPISSVTRLQYQNIRIEYDGDYHETSPTYSRSSLVAMGMFQSHNAPVTYADIFEDLKIIYPALLRLPETKELVLMVFMDDGRPILIHESDAAEQYPNPPIPRKPLGKSGLNEETVQRHIILVLHSKSSCKQPAEVRCRDHVTAACFQQAKLKFDSAQAGYVFYNQEYANPTLGTQSRPAALTSPTSKRKRFDQAVISDEDPDEVLNYMSEINLVGGRDSISDSFESNVKYTRRHCAISKENNGLEGVLCGPGFEPTNIVPANLWFSYPTQSKSPFGPASSNTPPHKDLTPQILQERFQKTWSVKNGLILRSDIQALFRQRLIAIHPVTLKIRVFGPFKAAMKFHGEFASIKHHRDLIDPEALKYHYRQCVIENCAVHLLIEDNSSHDIWKNSIAAAAKEHRRTIS